jgi:1-deoxy-D-xylulose-5-phosphate synthase
VVTIEDGAVTGGFGSAVAELLHAHDLHDVKLKIIGLPDKFVEHGAPAILRELYGLSSGNIKQVVRDLLRSERVAQPATPSTTAEHNGTAAGSSAQPVG